MGRIWRWIGILLGTLAAIVIIAAGAVYMLSERIAGRTYPVAAAAIPIPTDPASIAEGHRLAVIRECYGGCHGREAEGAVMFEDPMIARIVAPNLTVAAHTYSDAELVALIRQGVRPSGRSLLVMPSEVFAGLTDQDLGRIIAFLRSLPAVDGTKQVTSIGPLGRLGLVAGKYKPAAQLIAEAVPPSDATGEQAQFGRYLARTTCAQCHGTHLDGATFPDFTPPSLRVVTAYSADEFAQLLKTGVALGGRTLTVMGAVAQRNLSKLNDAEIAALYRYLHSMT